MATVFAALFHVWVHVKQAEWLDTYKRNELDECLGCQTTRVLSSDVQYVAFRCDPF